MRNFRKWRKVARRWQALQEIKAARGCGICGPDTTRDPDKLIFVRYPGRTDVKWLSRPECLLWHELTAALDANTVLCRSHFRQFRAGHFLALPPVASITVDEIDRYGILFRLEPTRRSRRRWRKE